MKNQTQKTKNYIAKYFADHGEMPDYAMIVQGTRSSISGVRSSVEELLDSNFLHQDRFGALHISADKSLKMMAHKAFNVCRSVA